MASHSSVKLSKTLQADLTVGTLEMNATHGARLLGSRVTQQNLSRTAGGHFAWPLCCERGHGRPEERV